MTNQRWGIRERDGRRKGGEGREWNEGGEGRGWDEEGEGREWEKEVRERDGMKGLRKGKGKGVGGERMWKKWLMGKRRG